MNSKILRIIFLKETIILAFALVWLWFNIGIWVDTNYSQKDLQPHYGMVVYMDSTITKIIDKPLYKEIQKRLRLRLNTDRRTFTLLTTHNFGFLTSYINIGDTVILFTKPTLWGLFGLRKTLDIIHLIKDGNIILDYKDYRKSLTGIFYLTFIFSIIMFIIYISKLKKRLWWDFE